MNIPYNIVQYARDNIPFYKECDIDVGKWDTIPIIGKEDFSKRANLFVNPHLLNCDVVTEWTSGTTGNSLKILKTKQEILVAEKRIWKWRSSYIPTSRLVNMLTISYRQSSIGGREHVKDGMFGSMRCSYLSINDISQRSPDELYSFVQSIKPYWVMVTATTLINLIFKLEKAQRWHEGCLDFICVIEFMSEMVTSEQRKYIAERIKCKMISTYGMRETWPIALECACGNLHVCEELVYCENSKKNEIIITSRYQKLMPVIKYNTGDLGTIVYQECSCGKNGHVIKDFKGRIPMYFEIGDGQKYSTKIFALAIEHLQNNMISVGKYRVVQKDNESFEIFIEGNPDDSDKTQVLLKRYLEAKLNIEIELKVHVKEVLLNDEVKWKVFSRQF